MTQRQLHAICAETLAAEKQFFQVTVRRPCRPRGESTPLWKGGPKVRVVSEVSPNRYLVECDAANVLAAIKHELRSPVSSASSPSNEVPGPNARLFRSKADDFVLARKVDGGYFISHPLDNDALASALHCFADRDELNFQGFTVTALVHLRDVTPDPAAARQWLAVEFEKTAEV